MFKKFAVCFILILLVGIPVNATIYLDLETIDNVAVNLANTPVADVYYASMDIYTGIAPSWGGLSLYSDANGTGDEMFLIGFDPGNIFGVRNKQGSNRFTDVADYVADETYHLILEVDRVNQTIKLWVDNDDFDAPDYSGPPVGGVSVSGKEFQAPLSVWCFVGLWGATGEYSNILISDSAEDHFVLTAPLATVAHWPMDEGAGTVVTDVVGDNNGVMVGSVSWIDGVLGTGVSFDVNDPNASIFVPNSEELDFGDVDFSVSLMVRYPTVPGATQHEFVTKGTTSAPGTGNRYTLFHKNDRMRFEIDNDAIGKSSLQVSDANFISGEWVHIVAVRDSVNDLLLLYADGALQGTAADISGDISSGEDMYIGNSPYGNNVSVADIDDMRIYAAVLTEDMIGTLGEIYEPLLINGSFELPGTYDQIYGFNGESHPDNTEPLVDIPGWATDGDSIGSGIELGTMNSDAAPDGDWVAFLRGIDPGIWQLTEHVIESDDVIVLSLDAKDLWAELEPLPMTMTIYYDDNGTRAPIASVDHNLVRGEWHTFTLTVSDLSSVPEAIGKKLGVEIDTPGDFTWALIDNVVLEVL